MKKPLLIVIALACVIAGCKLDEAGFKQSSALPSSSALVGMWFVKYVDSYDPIMGTSTDTLSGSKDYFMFNSDHTVKISTSYTDDIAIGKYTYSASNKKLTITSTDEVDNFTVKKLTADSLVMSIKAYITLGSGNNTTVDSSNIITYRLAH